MNNSRRRFLQGALAAAGTSMVGTPSWAATPTYLRANVSGRLVAGNIDSYKKAIRAMLALPPTDPRNWYRIALSHLLDCPHGNWWFLPWHRGYLGWFEQQCRELSGDSNFALPYWDWTTEPRIPAVMFDDVLNPDNEAFIASFAAFKAQFEDPISKLDYWKRVTKPDGSFDDRTPYGQILIRQTRFPADIWFDLVDNPHTGKLFCDRGETRSLTAQNPDLDADTQNAVAKNTVLDALSPRDFNTFGSFKTKGHSALAGFGVLEGMPHNLVHNAIGTPEGFMANNFSPLDPIFFLHHSNVDRLWDVWTRKQIKRGYPILPDGYLLPDGDAKNSSDYGKWAAEPFLFFTDAKGVLVSKTTAADYADIGDFDYWYEPGTGEEVVGTPAMIAFGSAAPVEKASGSVIEKNIAADSPARARVTLPMGMRDSAPKTVLAFITIDSPPGPGDRWDVYVGEGGAQHVATLSMFGNHGVHEGNPITFTVPISSPTKRLASAGQSVEIQVRARSAPSQAHGSGPSVTAVRVEAVAQ
jgi:tyrosinase